MQALASKFIVFRDDYGAVSRLLLELIRAEALTRGRWDSIAELLVNMDAVEKKNKELPQVAASC